MTWTDLSRRAATVILVALCVVAVPAIASAKFTSAQSAGQTVGTATMQAPSGVTGSYTCNTSLFNESMSVTVNPFAPHSPEGSSYNYKLLLGATVKKSSSNSSPGTANISLPSGNVSNDYASTTWTVRIDSSLASWTSGAWTKSITCPATGTRTATF